MLLPAAEQLLLRLLILPNCWSRMKTTGFLSQLELVSSSVQHSSLSSASLYYSPRFREAFCADYSAESLHPELSVAVVHRLA